MSKTILLALYAVVIGPLRHDGKRYQAGETVELTPAQAAPLLRDGVVVGRHAEAEPETLEERILDAIDELDPDNKDHWTNDGKPDATALAEIVGERVSAKLRDQVWEAHQAGGDA